MELEKRRLGRTNLHIAPLVFGGNVFGWTLDEGQSFAVLDEFMRLGFNAVDTADVYSRWVPGNSGGESETILGKWMKSRNNRDKVVLITKVGSDMGQGKKDLSEKYIMKAVEESLRRLQTDRIDLYLSHWDDESTPVEETLSAYAKLVRAGKVRWIGASNFPAERLEAAIQASSKGGLPRYEVFEPEYNLCERKGFEQGAAEVCARHGLGVITYYSLASGFLTGKYRSAEDLGQSARGSGVKKYLNERGMRILAALDEVAARHEVAPAAVSLAWLMARPGVTAPIASATKSAHVQAFLQAARIELSAEDMARLNDASA
ncbi:NADP-dependent oxidoreductase domain containing protein [Desulfovibrio sp. X2]|uniref:aldo/keto reductase n=1 Tax=Desulfovibrio sp. X2 TaxID=941449 RepID=UPI000358E974|nr:aldo/keto reductase [Desulfovibrio sp. X2]EPR37025.1 NADP-dependent oxidoreductase domain containing protein [Desulfovibrio sp. X2]